MLEEFKKFLIKGNMVDMAVGFIFGGAFATSLTALLPRSIKQVRLRLNTVCLSMMSSHL